MIEYVDCADCGIKLISKYTKVPVREVNETGIEIGKTIDCGLKTQKFVCRDCFNERKKVKENGSEERTERDNG